MGMILRIASSRIVGQGDIVGRSGYFSLNLSANSVMRGRLDARRTLKSLVADLRLMNHGGKGANQAVAAARLGGDVTFICKIGNDIFGNETLEMFHKEKIDTTYVGITPQEPSGVALINVDKKGENCIYLIRVQK